MNNPATVEGETMGLGDKLRNLTTAFSRHSRPHRSIADKLRGMVAELTQRLQEIERDRDEARAELRTAIVTIDELEQERHEQDVENRKLQGSLDVAKTENKGLADLIVYYETHVQAKTAIEGARAARATQSAGGAFDGQSLFNRD